MVDIVLPLLASAVAAAMVYTLFAHRREYAERRARWRATQKRISEKQTGRLLPLGIDVVLVVSVVGIILGIALAGLLAANGEILSSEDVEDAVPWCIGGGTCGLMIASGIAFVLQFVREGPDS